MSSRYQRPGWFTTNVFNRIVTGFTHAGISVLGSRVLEVRGRTSGQWRRTPVNLLAQNGERYLVAPRGQTQWVRNLRASGEGRLLLGRKSEPFTATELNDEEKPPLLRAYLKRWKFEVGMFFGGVGPGLARRRATSHRSGSPGLPPRPSSSGVDWAVSQQRGPVTLFPGTDGLIFRSRNFTTGCGASSSECPAASSSPGSTSWNRLALDVGIDSISRSVSALVGKTIEGVGSTRFSRTNAS